MHVLESQPSFLSRLPSLSLLFTDVRITLCYLRASIIMRIRMASVLTRLKRIACLREGEGSDAEGTQVFRALEWWRVRFFSSTCAMEQSCWDFSIVSLKTLAQLCGYFARQYQHI